jgi:hypothetical protein
MDKNSKSLAVKQDAGCYHGKQKTLPFVILNMKVITLHTPIIANELLELLRRNLNTQFRQQRQVDFDFKIEKNGDAIEISQPEMYEGVLFKLEPKESELYITRNEHYVDDVNSLALESILYGLYEDLSDQNGVDLLKEG